MSIAERAEQLTPRNGFLIMYHPNRKANDGGALVQRVRKDAVSVFKEQGWLEYIEQAQPIGAKKEVVNEPVRNTQREEMSAALAELQRIKQQQAELQAKQAKETVTEAKPGRKSTKK